jgi:malonate transporter and related proteins
VIATVAALVPTFLLIALGYGTRRIGFLPDAFWPPLERLTYFVFLPALLVESIATTEIDVLAALPLAGAVVAGVVGSVALLVAARPLLRVDGPAFTSILQGFIRPNTYIGIAVTLALVGPDGVALITIAIAAGIPVVNILCVSALARWGAGHARGVGAAARGLATNPLLIGVAIGLALGLSGVGLPGPLDATLRVLAAAALPAGLMAVGAGLDFAAVGRATGAIAFASFGKLVVTPAISLLAALALGLEGLEATMAVLYNSFPTAAAAYVLARLMGGDAPLMAGIVTATTRASAVTLPVVLLLTQALW